jgi:hypothetical protein
MKRTVIGLLVAVAVSFGSTVFAQERSSWSPAPLQITLIPASGTIFTKGTNTAESSFTNYGLGGAVTANLNRYIGVEGEVGGSLGVSQTLESPIFQASTKSPNMLQYNGNLVVSIPTGSSVTPYVAGGVGGLTLFSNTPLGIGATETFLTGSVGGGVSWSTATWGVRADYRFVAVKSRDDAPAFFGQETRYGHRLYAGIVLNVR